MDLTDEIWTTDRWSSIASRAAANPMRAHVETWRRNGGPTEDQRAKIRADAARPWRRAFKDAAPILGILLVGLLNGWLFLDDVAGWILVVWIVATVALALLSLWWVSRRLQRSDRLLSEWDARVARRQELAD